MLNPKSETLNPKQIQNPKSKIQNRPVIIFLVGPTAAGKSAAAVELAKLINAEIISCDSMQVYKGLDIATCKPSPALRKAVPHHLIGVISPLKEYDVSQYRRDALKILSSIISKGKTPLFTGGTGLYMSVLVDGIFEFKAEIKAIREKLYAELSRCGSEDLYRRLKRADPPAAAKIHPNDAKRIIRALEVFEATGKPISSWQKERKGLKDEYKIRIFCLNMKRGELFENIGRRVEAMFKAGLARELKGAFKRRLSRTARFAIGLSELDGYFRHDYDLDEAKRRIKLNTRHYAKRQLTWFRKDKRMEWVDVKAEDSPRKVAQKLWKKLY
jgi:tRNA dimethylallyltransferase